MVTLRRNDGKAASEREILTAQLLNSKQRRLPELVTRAGCYEKERRNFGYMSQHALHWSAQVDRTLTDSYECGALARN